MKYLNLIFFLFSNIANALVVESSLFENSKGHKVILLGDIHTSHNEVLAQYYRDYEALQIKIFSSFIEKFLAHHDYGVQILHENLESYGINFLSDNEKPRIDVRFVFPVDATGKTNSSFTIQSTSSDSANPPSFIETPITKDLFGSPKVDLISIDPRIIYLETPSREHKLKVPFGALRYAGVEDDPAAVSETYREEALALKRKIEDNYRAFLREVFKEEDGMSEIFDNPACNAVALSDLRETFCSKFSESYFHNLYIPTRPITYKDDPKKYMFSKDHIEPREAYTTISELRLEYKVLTTIAKRPELLSIVVAGQFHTRFLRCFIELGLYVKHIIMKGPTLLQLM